MQKKVFDVIPPKEVKKAKEEKRVIRTEKLPREKEARDGGKFLRGSLVFVLLILIAAGAYSQFFLSKIEIEIFPKKRNVSFEKEIAAGTGTGEINVLENLVPGYLFSSETSAIKQFPASGKKEKSAKAQGVIRVYNNYHIPQALVANTGFLSEGKMFRSTKKIYVPVGSYVDVEVAASDPGADYNIKPATFSIPGLVGYPQYTSVYGKSFSPMAGGFIGDTPQVSQSDVDIAEQTLIQSLKKETLSALQLKAGEDYILFDGAVTYEVVDSFISAKVGDEADAFSVRKAVKARAMVLKKSDLNSFVESFVTGEISREEKIKEGSFDIEYGLEAVDIKVSGEQKEEGGSIKLKVSFSCIVYPAILEMIDKDSLRGKTELETQSFFKNQPAVETVSVKSWPFWMAKIPQDISKVRLYLNLD